MKKFLVGLALTVSLFALVQGAVSPIRVFFSPRHPNCNKVGEEFIEVINKCQRTFYGAIYMFTDKNICTALINAKKRGVNVALVADKASVDAPYGQVARLRNASVPVYLYQHKPPLKANWSGPLMHNKFFVCDQPKSNGGYAMMVGTGSFNWTYAASNVNCENFLFIYDDTTVKTFLQEFEFLKAKGTQAFTCHPDQERLAIAPPAPAKRKRGARSLQKTTRRIALSLPPIYVYRSILLP